MPPRADDFRSELRGQLRAAELAGKPFIEINAGDLHRRIGSYPGSDHRMPMCCEVMRSERRRGDEIISSPAKGVGASLTIRYRLPRENNPRTSEPAKITAEEQIRLEDVKASTQTAEQLKLSNQFATEQYKDLRSQIQELARSITNLEVIAVGGIVAYYAWIMTHNVPDLSVQIFYLRLKWALIIPILLPILGFFRSRRHMGQIHYIARYMREIEDRTPVGPEKGWEHFIDRHRRKRFGPWQLSSRWGFWFFQSSHFCVWLLVFVGTVLIAVFGGDLITTQAAPKS